MTLKPVLALLMLACMWDHDTIRMEREVFPGVHEILAGKFVRHSEHYYRWRLADRTERLRAKPGDPALTDDLAVAYEKTGDTDKAITLMREMHARYPERYETLANLGTFLIHKGQLKEGLGFVTRAIAVNPDAHFGREVVQARLVRYVLAVRAEGHDVLISRGGFASFEWEDPVEAEDLVRGLTGMMFFGRADSPVLAECLGDVLSTRMLGTERLACRAFLKASYNASDETEAARYREMAGGALAGQTVGYVIGHLSNKSVELETVEDHFRDELAEGREFFARIAADEKAWAEAGLDLDEQFAAKYYEVGRTEDVSLPIEWEPIGWLALLALGITLAVRSARKKRQGA